jgi:hypothetical protein
VRNLFIRFSLELIERGFSNYSAQAIMERIRWETDEADVDGRSTFKINNNYVAWYARKFMEAYYEHDGFFRTRHRVSGDKRAVGLPELTPKDFLYTNQPREATQ